MKISTILDKIDENQLFIPAFQREYVWKRDDTKQLLDSLIKEYPTGTMLTWETNKPPQLKGPHRYDEKQGAVRILLDGQQRITTLYMLIRGTIPPYYTLAEITNDTRGLYLNVETRDLEYYSQRKMEKDPCWRNITEIFQKKVRAKDICRELEQLGQTVDRERDDQIDDNINSVHKILDREFPEQTIPIKATIREAIDIFYKVNASGVALTDAELALAQISGYWPEARDVFKKKLGELENVGFVFRLDFLVAVIASHYLNGAWYPEGGAGEIAKATGAAIRAAGGELLPNHEVTRILLEGGLAVGVEVNISKGKQGARAEFRAPVIVSDAGAWNTFTRMLPASALPFRDQLKSPPEGFEVVELFLGLRRDPREMGFSGENYWIFESFDHDATYAQRNEVLDGRGAMAYLSFPSLKSRRAQAHTAEIIAPLSYGSLKAHRHEPWRRRSTEYESAKSRITRALLDLVERHHPGFGDLVEYSELATPLTFEHFTAAPSGTIYGYPGTPDKYTTAWLGPRTPIKNLYLTGSDVTLLGIMGALMGGVVTASCLLGGLGFLEVMRSAHSHAQHWNSQDRFAENR